MTDYVVTRWYRAPQLLLGFQEYTEAVDIWSAGCMIGEMLLGTPVFPGKTHQSQLEKIIEFTGFKQTDSQYYGPETSEYIMSKL